VTKKTRAKTSKRTAAKSPSSRSTTKRRAIGKAKKRLR
jgi:hypothetical protein